MQLSDWKLINWIDAVGGPSYREISLQAMDHKQDWNTATIGTWVKDGIPKRDDALVMIAVLRDFAHRNRQPYFIDEQLRQHARLFLRAAGRQKFADLDDDEIQDLVGHVTPPTTAHTHPAISDRVQPPPPPHREYLFGRQTDLEHTLTKLREHPVVIISGVGGEGKTSLAWFSALEARQAGLITEFDWVTDKRYLVDARGNLINLRQQPLDFTAILRSMVRRFGWHELTGITDTHQLKNLCSERLCNGSYLVVVDNLETHADGDAVIQYFQGMLTPRGRMQTIRSRVLATTRVKTNNPFAASVDIRGIHTTAQTAFLTYLERQEGITLQKAQRDHLAELTDGNPLFMMIAVHRYALSPTTQTFDAIIHNLEQGVRANFQQAFTHLFGDITAQLGPDTTWIAQQAALLSQTQIIEAEDLHRRWLLHCTEHSKPQCDAIYAHALYQLLQHRVLNRIGQTGRYSMHSLIRSYLLR